MVGRITSTANTGFADAQFRLVEAAQLGAISVTPGASPIAAHATLTPASVEASPVTLHSPKPGATLPHGNFENAAVNRLFAMAAYKANVAVVRTANEVAETTLSLIA
ncbi:MAG: hypothetical protein ACI9OJ_006045 [Myxococcota bacterium]|jgi:hypothetical protein